MWVRNEQMSKDLPDSVQSQYIGGPVVSDFNADARLDILIPICGDEACRTIANLLMLSNFVWTTFQINMQVGMKHYLIRSRLKFVSALKAIGPPQFVGTQRRGPQFRQSAMRDL